MKRWKKLILAISALGLGMIFLTGIDLINSRAGAGMVVLGGAGLLLSLSQLVRPVAGSRFGLMFFLLAGGGYFVWRAWSVGPVSLAVADVTLILLGLGIYLAVAGSDQSSRWIWLVVVVVMAGLNAGIAIYQELSPEVYYVWQDRSGDRQLVGGLFGHYNVFASFLNGSIFLLLSYCFLGKERWLRICFGVVAVAMILAVVFSGSRGGWLSFVVGGVVWMLMLLLTLKQRGSRMVGIASLVAVVVAVVAGVTAVGVLKKITQERTVVQEEEGGIEVNLGDADGGRFAFQQMAFEVFQDRPVFGSGPQAFSYRSLEKWDRDALGIWTALPVYAHNEFLQVLSDYGLVGFLILLGVFFVHLIFGVFGVLGGDGGNGGLSIWQLGAIGGLVAILCQSYFSFLFHFPALVALAALLLGILASKPASSTTRHEGGVMVRVMGRMTGLLGGAVSVGLVILGIPLAESYLLNREGASALSSARTQEEVLKAFDLLEEAGNKGKSPDLFGVVARWAAAYGNDATGKNQPEVARMFHLRAKSALERALELNPHFGEGIAGLPRANDSLGNYEEAEKGHRKAMKELWTREISLRPHYQAARSSFYRAFRADSDTETLAFLYESRRRLDRRYEIFRRNWDESPMRDFGKELDAWIAFYEGRALFIKGDDVWKNARPRNPELAYGILLEALKRFEKSKSVVPGKDPRWERDFSQLETHLKFLKAGMFQPVPLSEEEIGKLISSDPGLASSEGGR